ncbi:MAG: hypothetical protein ACTSYJ_10085 [Candidatus Thorarchaeota archaeon]
MSKWKINPVSLIAFTLSGVLVLMVQFGVISPSGLIEISLAQFIWVFWFSVIAFIISTVNLVLRIPSHAGWSTGFSGEIVRTVKIAGEKKDYFIRGEGDTSIKEALFENWPFSEQDSDSNWHVVDELGNDVTSEPLSSITGTMSVVIEEDNE